MIWKAFKCSLTHADACEGTLLKFVSQALKNCITAVTSASCGTKSGL